MPSEDTVKEILRASKGKLHVDGLAQVETPPELRGMLARADSQKPSEPVAAPSGNEPFAVANIVFRNLVPWKGLRTGADILNVLSKDVAAARTVSEVQRAASQLPARLLGTGAYKSVAVDSATSASGRGVDLVVDLDENSFAISTNATQSLSGSLSTAAEVSVINLLGQAETISGRVGSATGDVMGAAGITNLLHPRATGGVGLDTGAASAAVARTAEMLATPTFSIELRKPTLGEAMTPVALRLRREVEYHDVTSGFRNKVLEAEASITDPSNTHSVSYNCAWRNLSPLSHPTRLYASASSPEVVSNCDSSLKSSVAYSYHRAAVNSAKAPTAGHKTTFRAEVAGAGGDVQFVKAAFSGLYSASLFRFAPDTGFDLPHHKAAFEASVGLTGTGQPAPFASLAADAPPALRPHPGPNMFSVIGRALTASFLPWDPPVLAVSADAANPSVPAVAAARRHVPSTTASSTEVTTPLGRADDYLATSPTHHLHGGVTSASTTPSSPSLDNEYTWVHRLAGWLAPGITGQLDVSLGCLRPFGASAQRPYGTRIVDRFFLTGSRMRGFDSVGPKADPVEAGTASGDVLGGDYMAALTARVLLPPPLPSVRLANAGLRTQAWATVGSLATTKEVTDLPSFLSKHSAAAGVGLYLPLVSGAALEANWALAHKANKMDVTASFRMNLAM